MAASYQIIASSPAVAGTSVNTITGAEGVWKTQSTPAFVTVKFDAPIKLHHIKFVNAGSAIVEILGLPPSASVQGANAKDSEYLVRHCSLV